MNLLRAMIISIVITIGAEIVTLVILAFPAAYAVARIPTRLSAIAEAIIQPWVPDSRAGDLDADLYDDRQEPGCSIIRIALVILYPAFSLPLAIILLTSFMRKLPRELEESAVMDGGNVLQIIFYIFVPISMPGIITVLVLNFINIWNEYLFALILMDSDNRTIQLALALLRANQRQIDYGLIAAGVLISMIPVFIIFIFFQDKIMSGMLAGAIKE